MVHVYLIQHGKAYPKEIDPDRKLTEEGIHETELIAKHLSKVGVRVKRVVHSGKLRASMTAEILAKILGVEKIESEDGLNPLDDPSTWRDKLIKIDEDIMVVGHLPHLSKLVSQLLNVDTEVVKFKYSGVLCLERGEDLKWVIKWYITPDVITK